MNNHGRNIIFAAITLLAVLISLFSFAAFSKSKLETSARSAVLYEPENKEFLYTKAPDEKLPMASTTKIMTALVLLESGRDLSERVSIDERATGIEGSSAYFQGGEVYTLYDLFAIMMLRSANDAAMQIAITVSGDVDSFVDLMNSSAVSMGLKSTSFTNPSGLDGELHYTTARELAIIADATLKHDVFSEIVSKRSYTATELSTGKETVYVNHNKLLSSYEGCFGVKTGYTKKSGRSLVSAAERDGVRLIAVTINAPDDWADHKKLLDFGFSELEYINAVTKENISIDLDVVNSTEQQITVGAESDFGFTARRGKETKVIYDIPRYLIAPISAGDTVGQIKIYSDGVLVGTVNLIAEASAEKEKTFFEKLIQG